MVDIRNFERARFLPTTVTGELTGWLWLNVDDGGGFSSGRPTTGEIVRDRELPFQARGNSLNLSPFIQFLRTGHTILNAGFGSLSGVTFRTYEINISSHSKQPEFSFASGATATLYFVLRAPALLSQAVPPLGLAGASTQRCFGGCDSVFSEWPVPMMPITFCDFECVLGAHSRAYRTFRAWHPIRCATCVFFVVIRAAEPGMAVTCAGVVVPSNYSIHQIFADSGMVLKFLVEVVRCVWRGQAFWELHLF